jgi:hypothetical protein
LKRSALCTALWLWGCGAGAWQSGTLHPRYQAHTRASVTSAEQLVELSLEGSGRLTSVKFVITDFDSATQRVLLLDGHFYLMHDEWYWYQLVNGRSLFGDRALGNGPGFASVRQAETWLRAHGAGELPLRISDERVYSEHFYELVLARDRPLAVGALVHVAARGERPAYWGFELEYTDRPDARMVAAYFAALSQVLPPELAAQLCWLTRSPDQEALREELKRSGSPLAARVRSYAELAAPGEIEVYNPGTAVGRLAWAHDQIELLANSDAHTIAILDRLPDMLPPGAAFVSTVPQTPLSHLNILARNRGVPSVYLGGLATDAHLAQLARAQAPVVLDVREDRVVMSALSEAEYAELLRESWPAPRPVTSKPMTDPSGLPYAVSLSGASAAQIEQVRDAIGGKAAGLALLGRVAAADVPEPLLALTVRGYAEHLQPLEATLQAMLKASLFRLSRDVRYLVLEGAPAHRARFGEDHAELIAQQVARRGGVLQELVARGGLRVALLAQPLPGPTRLALHAALQQSFGGLPPAQGLRFRSSATNEDVQGFTAAGLYASHTGFLNAEALPKRKDRERSAEHALKQTWASYWGFEAFEEREAAGVEHLRGRMAVLVHPRFDDERELANGVVTFTTLPPGGAQLALMNVNVQPGALSVTNPPLGSTALPEVDLVVLEAEATDGVARLQRVRGSTELPAGQYVLSAAELAQLFGLCHEVATSWLELDNARLDPARRSRVVTLDFEFKIARADWPRTEAVPEARRLVLKQVRSLEPAAQLDVIEALDLPVPRDVARRAVQLQRESCEVGAERIELLQVLTSSSAAPDLGFSTVPFLASVTVQRGEQVIRIEHPELTQPGAGRVVGLAADAAARYGRSQIDSSGAACQIQVEARSRAMLLREAAARGRVLNRVR